MRSRNKGTVGAGVEQRAPLVTWLKTFGTPGTEKGEALAIGATGDVFVLAWSNAPGMMGSQSLRHSGDGDVWLARISREGAVTWAKSIGSVRSDFGADVAVDGTGDLFVLVYFGDHAVVQDKPLVPGWHVIKLRGASGSLIWTVPFRESVRWQPQLAVLTGKVIVSAERPSGNALLFALDSSDGESLWTGIVAPSNSEVRAIRWQTVAEEDRVFLANQSLDSEHQTVVTIIAVDASGGTELWRRTLASVSGVRLGRLRSNGSGVCAVGEFTGLLQEDEGKAELTLPSSASEQNYIACWDASGRPTSFRQFMAVERTMDFLIHPDGMTIVGRGDTSKAVLCHVAAKNDAKPCTWTIEFPLPRSILPAYRLAAIGSDLILLGTFQGVLRRGLPRSSGVDFLLARIRPR